MTDLATSPLEQADLDDRLGPGWGHPRRSRGSAGPDRGHARFPRPGSGDRSGSAV